MAFLFRALPTLISLLSGSGQMHLLEGIEGGSKQSGFIQRMVAEAKLKNGEYKPPTKPLSKESTMNKPVAFEYDNLASEDQYGTQPNRRIYRTKKRKIASEKDNYGASPFIQEHFGSMSSKLKTLKPPANRSITDFIKGAPLPKPVPAFVKRYLEQVKEQTTAKKIKKKTKAEEKAEKAKVTTGPIHKHLKPVLN